MLSKLITTTAVALALAYPAFAADSPARGQQQQGTPPGSSSGGAGAQGSGSGAAGAPSSGSSGAAMTKQSSEVDAEKLIGRDLVGPQDESVGEIDSVMLGRDGKVQAVIVDVGGFLGMGAKTVAIKWDEITPPQSGQDNAKIKTTMTKQELEALPEFQYAENTDRGKVFTAPGGQSGSSGTSGSMPGRTTNPEGAPPAGTSGNDTSGTRGTGSGSR